MAGPAQIQKNETSTLAARARRYIGVGLTAGLMGLGGSAGAKKPQPTVAPTPTPSIISGLLAGCKTREIEFVFEKGGKFILPPPPKKCTVLARKGDVLLGVELVFEKAGMMALRVAGVDQKGVTLRMEGEVFMSEFAARPIRVNYGKKVRGLKAARTKDPAVAKITMEPFLSGASE